MNKKISMILLKIYPKLFWYFDGEPKRCTDCFHDKFVETPTANLNGIVCESYINCKKCGAFAQEWGYGYYNTNNMEPAPWWLIWKQLCRKAK